MYLPIHPAMKTPQGKIDRKYIMFDGLLNVYKDLSDWMDPFEITRDKLGGYCSKCHCSSQCKCEAESDTYKVLMIKLVL